jgi:hypothetical protein
MTKLMASLCTCNCYNTLLQLTLKNEKSCELYLNIGWRYWSTTDYVAPCHIFNKQQVLKFVVLPICFQWSTISFICLFFCVHYKFGLKCCNKIKCILVICQAVRLCTNRNDHNPTSLFVFFTYNWNALWSNSSKYKYALKAEIYNRNKMFNWHLYENTGHGIYKYFCILSFISFCDKVTDFF